MKINFSSRVTSPHSQPAVTLWPSTICPLSLFQASQVTGIIHRHQTSKKLDPILAAHVSDPFCDGTFGNNSSRFLAAPYAGCNRRGILRRVDRRSISQTSRHRVSSTTRERREASAVVERRPGPSYRAGHRAGRPGRGFVTLERPLPRFVEVRRLARGSAAFYFRIPTHYRKLGCEMANDLGQATSRMRHEGKATRRHTQCLFDEWNDQREGSRVRKIVRHGTSIGCSGNTRFIGLY